MSLGTIDGARGGAFDGTRTLTYWSMTMSGQSQPWYSETWTWFDGGWHEGNPPLMGPRSHAFRQGTSVADGARVFEGVRPDIASHPARVNRAARTLGLKPTMEPDANVGRARERTRKVRPGP